MKIDTQKLKSIEVIYDNSLDPPPFSYIYELKIDLEKDLVLADYKIHYVNRDELDEEDIIEEGFTLNDDYEWKGQLPSIWINEVKNFVNNSKWTEWKEDDEEYYLKVILTNESGQPTEASPVHIKDWEYFLQEFIQAIYEISEKEMPLVIRYKEISPNQEITFISIKPSFSQRTVEIVSRIKEQTFRKEHAWNSLRPIFEVIYMPDYDHEKSSSKEPVKPGKFIDNGEGLWYEFGKGVRNPDKRFDALKKMEKKLKEVT